MQRGAPPYGYLTDPLLDPARYVYLESSIPALLALAHGRSDWSRAVRDGSVTAAGHPALMSRVGEWFRPVAERSHPR
ncbi:hypothetical protein B9C99_20805 [Rhodococcus sp. BUPNP1]|nr:hypothetical protein B9C99_20805 [Rhodococcus sp. BUPNP1]